jgi:hypothetical protein
MLPEGGSRVDLRNRGLFYQYAARNAIAWYRFVNGPDLGRQAENGSLYLITGCDKSPAWGVASYSHPFGAPDVSLKFTAVGEGEDSTSPLAYSWENYSSAAVRTGRQQDQDSEVPVGPESSANSTPNQCVFIRGLRISLQPHVLRILLGDKVKVEEGFNPLCEVKNSITSTLPRSTTNSSSLPLIHGSPCYGMQHSNNKMNENDILLEHISDVSKVSSYFVRC